MAIQVSNQTNTGGIVYTEIILSDGTIHELPKSSDYGIRYVPDPLLVDNGTFTFVRDACDVLGTGAFKRTDVALPLAATDALMLDALHDILYSALQTSGGGGGGGDATAANQVIQSALLTDIKANQTNGNQITNCSITDGSDAALGSKADIDALTDTGIYSLISLFKRLLVRITSLINSTISIQGNTYTTANNTARYATVTSVTAAVNTVSGLVLAADLNRRSCTIWNSGAAIVFLGVGVPAVVNSGIRLAVNSSYTFDMCPLNQINAITPAGAATLTIIYNI